jgi:hypothetical protein
MLQSVEDEIHFLLHCPTYSTQHDKMLTDYQLQNNCDFTHTCISDTAKLKLLLNTSVKPIARFIIQIFNIRTVIKQVKLPIVNIVS